MNIQAIKNMTNEQKETIARRLVYFAKLKEQQKIAKFELLRRLGTRWIVNVHYSAYLEGGVTWNVYIVSFTERLAVSIDKHQ